MPGSSLTAVNLRQTCVCRVCGIASKIIITFLPDVQNRDRVHRRTERLSAPYSLMVSFFNFEPSFSGAPLDFLFNCSKTGNEDSLRVREMRHLKNFTLRRYSDVTFYVKQP